MSEVVRLSREDALPRPPLRLRPLRLEDELDVRDAQRTMGADGFDFAFELAEGTDWSSYVAEQAALQHDTDLPSGRVPATFLVATVDDVIIGRTSIRHHLNDRLRAFGGHIGYCVLPNFRRQGFATEMLWQSLVIVRSLGVERVLLTCDEGNLGSSTVIERSGGCLDPDWPRTLEDPIVRRYWIV